MRFVLCFALVALIALAGCCAPAPCGPAYAASCPPASAGPCGHRVDVMQDGSRHFFEGYKGGIWRELPPASLKP